MNLDQLFWGTGLVVVALAIVVLNDRMKNKGASQKPDAAHPTPLRMLIGVILAMGVIGLSTALRHKFPDFGWVVVPSVCFGIIALAVVVAFRKVIRLFIKSALAGRLPLLIIKDASGQMHVKCPKCSHRVPVTPGPAGETAFQCPQCGETATWLSESKSLEGRSPEGTGSA
jgi:uncharacterized C2H2 Zn-finger protein